ncbi:MAG: TetR/AcrR family transcriptional regulator [Deltaproteobacteria bacterium]|nr:TetR/AcrR family transcriptional regulator [Candidatus Deferrimicrobiaceae bacterium]
MATAKRSRESRREQIAEAALEVISRRGTRSLSVVEVARRTGIVPSAIYRHFHGKEEILSAAIERMGERLLENVAHAAAGKGGAIERLRSLLRSHVRTIRQGFAGPRIIFAEGIDGGGVSHRMEVYHVIRRYLEGVAEIVRQGQQDGDLKEELDPGSTAVHFLGLVQPAATLWYLSAGKFDAALYADRSFDQFAFSIRTG